MLIRLCLFFLLVASISSCDDPTEECVVPDTFEENVIGTWNYNISEPGQVKINADGTYEDIMNEIISNGEVTSRTWRIEDEQLIFDVENASLMLAWTDYDCDSFTLDFQGLIPNVTFTRVE